MSDTDSAIARLVTTKPDAELAADFKRRTVDALQPVLQVLTEAREAGFIVSFNLEPDWSGKTAIKALVISKQY